MIEYFIHPGSTAEYAPIATDDVGGGGVGRRDQIGGNVATANIFGECEAHNTMQIGGRGGDVHGTQDSGSWRRVRVEPR